MSKFDEKVELYTKDIEKFNNGICDVELLKKVVKGLGPSIYNNDSERVSCSDNEELARVRENFLKKKLSLTNSDEELDQSIKEVCEQLGSANKNKFRATFYYLLVKKYGAEAVYA